MSGRRVRVDGPALGLPPPGTRLPTMCSGPELPRYVADVVARAAARLIALRRTHQNSRIVPRGGPAVDQALSTARVPPAHLADGMQLQHVVRQREQPRHKAEGQPTEILVEPGRIDRDAAV